MTVSGVIKTVLNSARLEWRRRNRSLDALISLPKLGTAGRVVEFIGTQGVGKSTLNNDLYKHLKRRWFFRCDLIQLGPAPLHMEDIEQLHRTIYFTRIAHLEKSQPDPWKSITVARQMAQIVSESLTIQTNDFPRGFFMDEGLFKNFPHEMLGLAQQIPSSLWRSRAFIYMRARDPEFALARYQSRVAERSNRGRPLRRADDADVLDRINRENALFDEIAEKARLFDCPVIVVYAEDPHQENMRKILDFETSLYTRFRHTHALSVSPSS